MSTFVCAVGIPNPDGVNMATSKLSKIRVGQWDGVYDLSRRFSISDRRYCTALISSGVEFSYQISEVRFMSFGLFDLAVCFVPERRRLSFLLVSVCPLPHFSVTSEIDARVWSAALSSSMTSLDTLRKQRPSSCTLRDDKSQRWSLGTDR